ncbi:MAG: hypothetical protein LBV39_04670 [Bacteroidales bacterium]|jgi:ABC-type phosphate transport system substrate-binding protein|nr:hypothetical protein [Bacteroidales bacterium]
MNILHRKTFLSTGILLLTIFSVFGKNPDQSVAISTNGSKFVAPLLTKWVAEYQKVHPGTVFNIVETSKTEDIALSVVVSQTNEKALPDKSVTFAGRYALLPVSHPQNPLLTASKGLNKKELKHLLFEKDILDDSEPQKDKYKVNVYTPTANQGSTSVVLAGFFDAEPTRIKGKKVYGDETVILRAVGRDPEGIAYSNLNYVFNLDTRQLKPELSLLPLNIKSKQKEKLYSANVDQVISLLENESIDLIPVTAFGFAVGNVHTPEVTAFVQWVLTDGQQYIHELGFLQLDENTLAAQQLQLKSGNYLSLK